MCTVRAKGLTHLDELNPPLLAPPHNVYTVCLVDWARTFSTQQL